MRFASLQSHARAAGDGLCSATWVRVRVLYENESRTLP